MTSPRGARPSGLARPGPEQRYRALLIGVSTYNDPSPGGYQRLSGPPGDVKELRKALTTGPRALFHEQDVKVIPEPNLSELRKEIVGFLEDSKPHDTVLLYFSGHGDLDQDGTDEPHLHLLPHEATRATFRSAGVPSRDISGWLRRCPARQKIVILDCCFASGFKGVDVGGEQMVRQMHSDGRFVLAASRSQARDGLEVSPFTALLVRGLQEATDEALTMRQLALWLEAQAPAANVPLPHSKYEGTGEIVIAGAAKPPQRAVPARSDVPRLTITFRDRHLHAVLPDGRALEPWPLPASRARAGYMEMVDDLTRLASDPELCRHKDFSSALPVLVRALARARDLAGQALFDDLFGQPALRETVVSHLGHQGDPRLELRLELSDADPDAARTAWEYLYFAAPAPAPAVRFGERFVVVTRGVTSDRPAVAGWKGAGPAVNVLVHAEFAENHPLLAAIRAELAAPPSGNRHDTGSSGQLRAVRPATVLPANPYDELVDALETSEVNVLVLVGSVSDRSNQVVLHAGHDLYTPDLSQPELDRLFDVQQRNWPPLEMVVLETVPRPNWVDNGFSLTASLASKLASGFGCPVVGICHTEAYLASLGDETPSPGGEIKRLRTLTACALNALRRGTVPDQYAFAARQEFPHVGPAALAVPIIYLPTPPATENGREATV